MSQAERFEDEKRRIIESCFGKKEPDGSISESYITHIRILEDAAHPSTPPPFQSPNENKKPRIIVIAVRKSGRVRMHKARENNNGSFSIGKTWVLDDLSAILSYTNLVPNNADEQQAKERAGAIGFVVTIQKPYYWQASTAKEKEFFIFSLIKIYKKYTAGKLPQLFGFEPQELEQFGGSPIPPNGPSPRTPYTATAPHTPGSANLNGGQALGQPQSIPERPLMTPQLDQNRAGSREPRQRPSEERSLQSDIDPRSRPSQERSYRTGSENRSQQSRESSSHIESESRSRAPQDRILRTTDSNDRMPYVPGQFPTSDFVRNLRPQHSQTQISSQRSDSPSSRSAGITQPEPSLRKLAGTQSTESFRGGSETQSNRYQSSRRPSEERSRQAGALGMNTKAESSDSLRPSTTEKTNLVNGISQDAHRLQDRTANLRLEPSSSAQPKILSPGVPGQNSRDPLHSSDRSIRDENDVYIERDSQAKPYTNGDRLKERSEKVPPSHNKSLVPNAENNAIAAPTTSTNSATPTSAPAAAETPDDAAIHRPGLGPMIRAKRSNKEIAATFRNAAKSYNAFKPRAGGAADKLRDNREGSGNEPDGITGVVPAPSLVRDQSQGTKSPTPDQSSTSQPLSPIPVNMAAQPFSPQSSHPIVSEQANEPPVVRVTTPPGKQPERNEGSKGISTGKPPAPPEKPQEDRRPKRKSDHSAKYAKALGVNPSVLEGRTFEIESILNDFGWVEESTERKTFDELQTGIRKELARVEAGSWLGAIENNDDRIAALGDMMDRVISECEEFDCLLTLYNVELGTLSEDVAYIEAQSQGLQVQTANQKLLQNELKTLLSTISISASELKVLKDASLTKTAGIETVEATLTQLYTAMMTIDPKLRHPGQRIAPDQPLVDRRTSGGGLGSTELSSMQAVRDKKEGYRTESLDFIQRLKQYLSVKFREMEAGTLNALEEKRRGSMSKDATKLDYQLREKPKRDLWLYSPLLLFTRETEPIEWEDMMRMYESCARKPYQEEFRDNIFAWKRITRKSTGDEQDVLFTSQEKENEGIVGRKLTVKRSKTVRPDGSSRIPSTEKPQDGKVNAYEAFAGALYEMAGVMFVEQNCVVDLFHVTSLENLDFPDAVKIPPEERRGGDLAEKKLFDPDRTMARKVFSLMEEIYSFFPTDLQNMVDWVIKQDALQGVGVLLSLESKLAELEDSNQEYLVGALTKVHDRLVALFTRFIDDQIRGIEDTKVKIKKRKGVIAFMKTFPSFTTAIENMIPPSPIVGTLPIRSHLNEAYTKINKAMFESLKFIAKETPIAAVAQTATAGGDPEDKEALNYHILLIENMNHYIEEVPVRNLPVLEEWKSRAVAEMSEHMDLYLSAVIRRPLGKLLDFLESSEALLNNLSAGEPATGIATGASHSRHVFKKILGAHDGKEIRRGIETLKKRVDKHFAEVDDVAGNNRALVGKVMRECEARYLKVGDRVQRIVTEVYEGALEVEWSRQDVTAAFRR